MESISRQGRCLVSLGAIGCHNPAEALDQSRHVVVCLASYSIWMKIIEECRLQDHLSGRCIIQLTGGTIDEVRDHAATIESHGGTIVDGSIMCFPRELGTGDASLLVAGTSDVLEGCDPLLRMLAPTWTDLGEDIIRPTVLSRSLTAGIVTSLIGLVNGIAICRAGGIPLEIFMEHVDKANSILPAEKRRLIDAVHEANTEETQASIDTWAGAHQTIHATAKTLGTDLLLQDAVKAVLEEGRRSGLGDHDLSALVEVFSDGRTHRA